MDIAITISNRELTPAVVNFFQHENQTVTLNFTLDSYMYGDVDLRNYKAYGVTSQNGMIDLTELEMNYDSSEDKLTLAWEVQEYSLRQEGAITYQICFKENADDGENTAVFYSYKGIMINRGSVDGDNHITANYPTILKQWLDRINELAGTLEVGIVYIPYGETIGTTERLAGRVYFQFTDSANTKGRFEDHEGKELNLSAMDNYLPLSGGKMSGSIYSASDDQRFHIGGGTNWDKGGHIVLGGKDSTDTGTFTVTAHNGSESCSLHGKPDGSLTWKNKNIVRSVNNTQANQSGDVTVDVGVTSVNGKKGALTPADTGCLPCTGGKITGELDLTSRPLKNVNNIELVPTSDQNHGGFFDFHYNGSTEDYTSRIIEGSEGKLSILAPNGVSVNNKHVVRSINGVTADNAGNIDVSGIPVGTIISYAGLFAPDGFLPCNGAAVSRTTYSELLDVIGTASGVGDGSTTFNLPNLNNGTFLEGGESPCNYKAAGLPNITGGPWVGGYSDLVTTEGAVVKYYEQNNGQFKESNKRGNYNFDASKSNSIYGASTTVQPKSATVNFCIKY